MFEGLKCRMYSQVEKFKRVVIYNGQYFIFFILLGVLIFFKPLLSRFVHIVKVISGISWIVYLLIVLRSIDG